MSKRYAVVDLGTKHAGALDAFRKSITKPCPPADCLGVDRLERMQEDVTRKGYHFLCKDIGQSQYWSHIPPADVYLAWDFLEHLSSETVAMDLIEYLLRTHSPCELNLRLPTFEQDTQSGEGALLRQGLRFTWTRWSHHTAHVRIRHVLDALARLQGLQPMTMSVEIKPSKLIYTTHDKCVVWEDAPPDTGAFDPSLKAKPNHEFPQGLVTQWAVCVRTSVLGT